MAGVKKENRHGMSKTPTYKSWEMMIQRCTNPNFDSYEYYGGRGIKVCKKWLDFRNFYADMGDKPEGKSLDRIDVNKNYEINNCKWSTQSEQLINRRIVSNNTSGYKGVYLHKQTGKWVASVTVDNKQIHLGIFNNKEDAVEARKKGEDKYYKNS